MTYKKQKALHRSVSERCLIFVFQVDAVRYAQIFSSRCGPVHIYTPLLFYSFFLLFAFFCRFFFSKNSSLYAVKFTENFLEHKYFENKTFKLYLRFTKLKKKMEQVCNKLWSFFTRCYTPSLHIMYRRFGVFQTQCLSPCLFRWSVAATN